MHKRKNKNSLGLYVHIPFCEKKCFYCSFVVTVSQKSRDEYVNALIKEMNVYKGKEIRTIYFGGGTPSALSEQQIEKLIISLKENFFIHPEAEFTFEGNPEHVHLSKIQLLKRMGVTRFSLGAQTFNDEKLIFLGRNHDRKAIFDACRVVRAGGFSNVNLDLMYGFPAQTMSDLNKDLEEIVKLNCEHISLYLLSVEKNSLFYVKKVNVLAEDDQVKQFIEVKSFLEKSGYDHYEISNFARKNKESRHNKNYWLGGNYVGLGVAAHSHIDGKRFWNVSSPSQYIQQIKQEGSACAGEETLRLEEQLMETFLFGLRMQEGVNLRALEQRYECSMDEQKIKRIEAFIKEGFLIKKRGHVKTTLKGALILDALCAQLI